MISKLPVILVFTVRAEREDGYALAPQTHFLDEAERMVDVCARRGYTAYIQVTQDLVRTVAA